MGSVSLFAQSELVIEGRQALKEGQNELAASLFEKAIAREPEEISNYHYLAQCWLNLKQYKRVDSFLWMVRQLDTANYGTWWYMGMSKRAQGDDSSAVLCFKGYIARSKNLPHNKPQAWLYVGAAYSRILRKTGLNGYQIADMAYYYQEYLRRAPEDPNAAVIRDFLDRVEAQRSADPAKVLIFTDN